MVWICHSSAHYLTWDLLSNVEQRLLNLLSLCSLLSGVQDYFGRNKISSGGDLSHYSSASLY